PKAESGDADAQEALSSGLGDGNDAAHVHEASVVEGNLPGVGRGLAGGDDDLGDVASGGADGDVAGPAAAGRHETENAGQEGAAFAVEAMAVGAGAVHEREL